MRRAALALGLAVLCGATAFAATPSSSPGAILDSPGNYRIETDTETANVETGAFTMPHRVKFSRPGTDAVADRADGNYKQGTASLRGNVVVHDSGNASEAGESAYRGNGPATLTCDRLDVDSKAKTYTAIGNVHFTQGSRSGTSERAVLDRGNSTLKMEGRVRLADGPSTMTAEVLDYNLNTKDVRVSGAPIVITQPVPSSAPGTPRPSAAPRRR